MASFNTTGNQAILSINSNVIGEVASIGGFEESYEVLDNDFLADTGHMKYAAGDLVNSAPVDIEVQWDPNTTPISATTLPLNRASVTGIISYPKRTGETTNATLTGSGFISSRTTPTLENNNLLRGQVQWQFDGATNPAYVAAT